MAASINLRVICKQVVAKGHREERSPGEFPAFSYPSFIFVSTNSATWFFLIYFEMYLSSECSPDYRSHSEHPWCMLFLTSLSLACFFFLLEGPSFLPDHSLNDLLTFTFSTFRTQPGSSSCVKIYLNPNVTTWITLTTMTQQSPFLASSLTSVSHITVCIL